MSPFRALTALTLAVVTLTSCSAPSTPETAPTHAPASSTSSTPLHPTTNPTHTDQTMNPSGGDEDDDAQAAPAAPSHTPDGAGCATTAPGGMEYWKCITPRRPRTWCLEHLCPPPFCGTDVARRSDARCDYLPATPPAAAPTPTPTPTPPARVEEPSPSHPAEMPTSFSCRGGYEICGKNPSVRPGVACPTEGAVVFSRFGKLTCEVYGDDGTPRWHN
ncbi:hypothetical protein KEM60_01059 [Austwickia sp. TVS 96-490-7B]|uniref:hypothetical protein n=1 Tax=Austwickia sp. TVS 96-490-7B TaxID=2830843 RepID=UPI001C58CDE0|nr:hypothetical protein [Austwickia sp. TVS 96-490-7B]MBW3084870.1 hypothetical protein [Austwickia sp. TVS 96-490-7B]